MSGAAESGTTPAAPAARPSLTLVPLGDEAAAVCDGDTCVIPGA